MRNAVGRRYGGAGEACAQCRGGASDGFGPGCAEVALHRECEYMEPGSSAVVAQGDHECRKVGEGMCPVTRCSQTLSSPAAETKKKKRKKEGS